MNLCALGMRAANTRVMLTAECSIPEGENISVSAALNDDHDDHGDDEMLLMPLTEAKRLVAARFERRYLVHVMTRANGSISEGARLAGLDRTNFRRLLQRHGLHQLKAADAAAVPARGEVDQ